MELGKEEIGSELYMENERWQINSNSQKDEDNYRGRKV